MNDPVATEHVPVGDVRVMVMAHASGTLTVGINVSTGSGGSAGASAGTKHVEQMRDLAAAIGRVADAHEAASAAASLPTRRG